MTMTTNPRRYSGYRDQALQERIYRLLDAAGHEGMTTLELQEHFDPLTEAGEGDITGATALLHQGLRIARLKEKRGTRKIYVQRDFLDSRPCERQGNGERLSKEEIAVLVEMRDFLDYWFTVDHEGSRFGTDRTRAERNHKMFFARARRLFGDSVNR